MHRIVRIAVSIFLLVTSFFVTTVLRDHGMLSSSEQAGGFAIMAVVIGGIRAVMYAADCRQGFDHEIHTKDSVTAETLLFAGGLMYAWLTLGILVGTGGVSPSYEEVIKPFLGWASLVVVGLTVVLYCMGTYRLRRGEFSLGGRSSDERREQVARELTHRWRA